MKILVLGNGFDIALGLPTKYDDFLKFLETMEAFASNPKSFICDNTIKKFDLDSKIENLIMDDTGNKKDSLFTYIDKFNKIGCNFWYIYFKNKRIDLQKYYKVGWVDFEGEISKIGEELTKRVEKKNYHLQELIGKEAPEYILSYIKMFPNTYIYYKDIHDRMCEDLDELKWLMKFYISRYINKLELNNKNILNGYLSYEDDVHIISFNYTSTVKKKYGPYISEDKIDYIHGYSEQDINDNGIVLGGEFETQEMFFSEFLKSSQRTQYRTDYKYLKWIETIQEKYEKLLSNNKNSTDEKRIHRIIEKLNMPCEEVIFYGHSMGMADKRIILQLFEIPNSIVKVFYYMKPSENDISCIDKKEKIRNLQNLLGVKDFEDMIARDKIRLIACR